jgi:hypothetical protein
MGGGMTSHPCHDWHSLATSWSKSRLYRDGTYTQEALGFVVKEERLWLQSFFKPSSQSLLVSFGLFVPMRQSNQILLKTNKTRWITHTDLPTFLCIYTLGAWNSFSQYLNSTLISLSSTVEFVLPSPALRWNRNLVVSSLVPPSIHSKKDGLCFGVCVHSRAVRVLAYCILASFSDSLLCWYI